MSFKVNELGKSLNTVWCQLFEEKFVFKLPTLLTEHFVAICNLKFKLPLFFQCINSSFSMLIVDFIIDKYH